MAYLTFNKLSSANFRGVSALNEAWKNLSSNKKVFLSYRRKDVDYIKEVIGFLLTQGVSVYIDYLDDTLPSSPDHTTAAKLRERIKKCDKFILLATPNSKDSYWMPWELGLGDGFIGYENTIVLPLLSYGETWEEKEYYKIYGYVKEGNSNDNTKTNWAVFFPNNEALWLTDWLKK